MINEQIRSTGLDYSFPKAISERMGHTEIGVTMNVYGHLFEGKQKELTQDLDDLLDRTRARESESTSPQRDSV